jgi:glycosyltransferase involved in cell wall biosynthesis
MNICAISWSVYKTDARVRKYTEALVEHGNQVDVITLASPQCKKTPNTYELNGVRVFEIDKKGVEKSIPRYIFLLLKFFVKSFLYCSGFAVKKKYELIHVHSIPDFEVFAAIVPKLHGARIILDIHDPVPDFFAEKFGLKKGRLLIPLLKFAERISTCFADHVITVTDYWMKIISERSFLSKDKISVVLNLPDIRLFNQNNSPNAKKENQRFTLLYPGTINKHCGLDVALRAINIVKMDCSNLAFEIYGKGTEYGNIKLLSQELELNDIVNYHEHIPWEDIPDLMLQADVGIALLAGTSIYSQQALNTKLFEYLAMGLPSIATRTKSTEYYLDDSVVLFSEINNPADVARCIRELYHSPAKRLLLRENGLNYIRKNNWNVQMNGFFTIVDKLLMHS